MFNVGDNLFHWRSVFLIGFSMSSWYSHSQVEWKESCRLLLPSSEDLVWWFLTNRRPESILTLADPSGSCSWSIKQVPIWPSIYSSFFFFIQIIKIKSVMKWFVVMTFQKLINYASIFFQLLKLKKTIFLFLLKSWIGLKIYSKIKSWSTKLNINRFSTYTDHETFICLIFI